MAVVVEVRRYLDGGIRFTPPDRTRYEYTADLLALDARWARFLESAVRRELSSAG
jgi:hypothetical protein